MISSGQAPGVRIGHGKGGQGMGSFAKTQVYTVIKPRCEIATPNANAWEPSSRRRREDNMLTTHQTKRDHQHHELSMFNKVKDAHTVDALSCDVKLESVAKSEARSDVACAWIADQRRTSCFAHHHYHCILELFPSPTPSTLSVSIIRFRNAASQWTCSQNHPSSY